MPKQFRFQPIEPLVPERIREARLARGMTTIDLATSVGVTRQAISKYELGIAEPSSTVLNDVANSLNMPLSYFHKPLSAPANQGTVFFRSLKTNAARAKDVLSVKIQWAAQLAHILSEDIIFPEADLPSLPEKYAQVIEFTYDDIEEITLFLRRYWGLGTAPVTNMSRLLESHGIIVASVKTGFSETDACSSFIEKRPFVFLDMQKECAVRTRFNLAHELGHLMLHHDISQKDLDDKKTLDRIEKEANQFASCFLLPRASFILDIRSTSLSSFLPLKAKWKTSIQAMVYRCRELEVFSENQMIYIQKQISAKKWRRQEPYDNEWPCEEPVILRTAIQMLIDRGDYSKEEFVELLRLPEKDIEEICSLPNGYLSPVHQSKPIVINFSPKTNA